jgi:hypothetical protein
MTDYLNKDLIEAYGSEGSQNRTFQRTFTAMGTGRTYLNEDTNVHVQSEYTKRDYYHFRQSEQVKKNPKLIIRMCMDAYENVGIIKNTIDLMGDFASKGIRIVHTNKSTQKFLRQWFRFVNGDQVTERFLNTLYRAANVVVERFDGKITTKTINRWKTVGFIEDNVKRRQIPKGYIIHNPLAIEKFGGLVTTERPKFKLRVSKQSMADVGMFPNANFNSRISRLRGGDWIDLDSSKIYDYYYKKDDWEVWAKPLTFAVMNELMMLDKVQLADMSALDGAISAIRLWRLGSFEYDIYPTREAINKLRRILANNVGTGGVLNLVWGAELDFKESNTEVHHFLGKEKYEAILTLIYAGLGIPPTLTGSSSGSGFTNNMISIKTMVERLQYGRDMVIDFWEKQLSIVMRAMGFSGVPRVTFTYNVLSDEAAEKALLIDLIDRDLVSSESVRDAFGFDHDIEQTKVSREAKRRGKTVPEKAGPYHNPQPDQELKKIALQSGTYAPSEVGLDMNEKTDEAFKEREKEMMPEQQMGNPKMPQEPGRPKNSKDDGPRKKKDVKPRSLASTVDNFLWFDDAHAKVSKIINPAYLNSLGKENLRNLTKQEYLNMEQLKLECLSGLEPGKDFSTEDVMNAIGGDKEKISLAHNIQVAFEHEHGRKPTIEEVKAINISSLSLL